MEKKLNFKKLLATASAFAVITGASNSAMGAAVTDSGAGDVVIGGGGTNIANAAAFANGDNFFFTNAGKALTTGGAITINAIDLNGKAPAAGGFTVAHAVTLGPVTDTGGANKMNVVVNDGIALTLANNKGVDAAGKDIAAGTFDGLGNIVLGAAAGTLTVDTDATLTGTIDSNVAAKCIININAGRTLTLSGVVGGNKVVAATNLVGADSVVVVNADVTATTILTKDATAKVQVVDGKTITGAVDATAAGGILFFEGAGTVTQAIGANNALTSIVANGAGAVQLKNAVEAQTLTVADAGADVQLGNANALTGKIVFTADGKVSVANNGVITGDVTTTAPNTGNLVFAKVGQVAGAIGAKDLALNTVEVTGAGAVALDGKAHYAETFLFKNAAAQLTIADGVSLHGNADADANAAGDGIIEFTANGEFDGTIGTTKNLLSVIANGAGTVKIGAGDHKVTTFKAANAGSIFNFADGANVDGAIDNTSGGVNATELNFAGSSTVTGNIGNANAFN